MKLTDIKARCRIEDGHWLWTGAKSEGWPRIWAPDFTLHGGELRTQTGRRAAWHLKTKAAIPQGWRVFGICQAKDCVNPAQMEARNVAEQGARVAASGRLKGQVNRITANRTTARKISGLTPQIVHQIRTSSLSGKRIAEELGTNRTTVSRIRTGKATAFQPVGLFAGLFSGADA